jgi:hypothetical protein
MSFTRFSGGGGNTSFSRFNQPKDPYDTTSLEKQIGNANTRIQDTGFKPQDGDSRNWFEKLTNLPQKQNAFFDTLELLGRPGNAVKNVLHKATGANAVESIGEALKKGISGKEKVNGIDLIDEQGDIKNGFARFLAGTGVDILTDPLTYVPGGVLAKGVSVPSKLAGKAVKGAYQAAENSIPSFARFSENVIKPAAESVKDGLGYAFNPNYKIDETLSGGKSNVLKDAAQQSDNSLAYMQEEAMKGVAGAAVKAGGIDTGVGVGRVMEKPLRQFEDVKGFEFPDGLQRTTDKTDLTNAMGSNRDNVKALGKEVNETRRQYESNISKTAQDLEKIDKQLNRIFATEKNKKLKTLIKGSPEQPKLVKGGFTSKSPSVNVLMKHSDELQTRISEMRKEIGSVKFRKKTYTPEQMDKMAEDRAFKSLYPSPAFNVLGQRRDELKSTLDTLRKGSKTVNAEKIAQIQNLVSDTEGLKEAVKNPVMIQQEIERPVREAATDPKIQEAAKNLTEINSTMRQYAEDNGIAISEMEGYMTHVFSQAERDARKINKPINVDSGSFGKGNPNKSILKQRELTGSVEDINERLGKTKFEPNAYFATAIGQKRLIDYIHAVTLRKQVLDNRDFAIPFKKGMDVPRNAEVIDSNNYTFLKPGDSLDGVVPTETIGGQYIVTKQAKMILDRYQKLNTDEGTKAFLKAFDGIQSLWKKGALFSVGYHVRNQAGAAFNNYVAGMNPFDLVKYTKQGFEEVAKSIGGKESEMFTEFRKQGLGSSTLSQVEFGKVGQEPEEAITKTVENMSKTKGEKIKQRLNPLNGFQTSAELGNFFDQANRFALYKWARDKGMSAEDAAAKVREVQFDYSKTTPFEKNVLTRVMPFYRWMRNNIPYQIKSFINDPRKYEYLNKARLNAQEAAGLNEDNVPEYMKQQFALPLYGKNGKGKMLGLNLPLTDLTKLSSPGKTLVDAVTPLLKTPAELSTNFNAFRGKAIQKFQGQQQQYQIPYTDIAFGIPVKTGYALDQMTGQIGRGLSGFLQKQKDQDTVNRLPSLGISSMAKPFDAEAYAYYEKLDQLKQAQDLMLYIQQQTGEKPRTLSQIKKGK